MSIRLPRQQVLYVNHTNQGTTSTAGGWAYNFTVPQDTDNIVVKVLPSVTAGGMSATLQTSDDGGSTWFDVGRTSVASANADGAQPQWLSATTISSGVNPIVISAANVGSIAGGSIGNAAASTLASRQVSGLPILGIQNRLFLISVGNATSIATVATVTVNQQSNGN